MDEACAQLEERAKTRAAAEQAEYERKVAERDAREGKNKGPKPKPPSSTPEPDKQINLTDADSSLMRKTKRDSYTQSYIAQAVVDADGSQLVLGARVSTCASDANELEPDLESVPPQLGAPSAALADCGYVNRDAFARIAAQPQAPQLYVSVHREDAHAERHYDYRPRHKMKPPKTITDPMLLAMAAKLRTEDGRALYRQRAQTVEPVFGIIKHVLGFRQFLLRGLRKVSGEWRLVCLAYNLKRLHTLRAAAS
jgi:hypothetical protein